MNLQDWENRLQPYLTQIELLAEIPLSQAEHAELEKLLGEFVQKYGLTEATRRLQRDYPAVFISYLTFKAAFNDERGFWLGVAKAIGQEGQQTLFNPTHHWGKIFLEIVEKYKLPIFSGVSGLEYVTSIRLHGGVSVYSLPDFFKHILIPSVQDERFNVLADVDALTKLLSRSTTEIFVDDAVQHFFSHAGKSAQRFFEKCRRMARVALQGNPLPSAEQLGLRPYILQAFESYLENPPEPSQRRRLPRIFFRPYQPAFLISLPQQPVPFELAGVPHFWHIYLITGSEMSESAQEKVRVRRSGQEWKTDETQYLMDEPAEYAQIQLSYQLDLKEEIKLKRSLRLLPASGATPLLAFRYEDGALRSLSPTLPAQTLWLFYPADVELRFEGEEQQIEALHLFAKPWEKWQAHAWDLSKVKLVRLLRNGQDICPPIPVSVVIEPSLEGQSVHPQSIPVEEKPLFLGAPYLRIPLRRFSEAESELKEWSLTLESRYAAQPAGEWKGKASELPHQIFMEEGCALVEFSAWLGEHPIGAYHLTLRGPGQSAIELPFRIWDEIEISGLNPYYLPEPSGSQEVFFYIRMPSERTLTAFQDDIAVEKKIRGWQVHLSKESSIAQLGLEYPAQPETVRVPLRVAAPRLRWALRLESSAALEWRSSPLHIPLAQLLQSRYPRLLVELPLLDEHKPVLGLYLKVPGKKDPLQSSESKEGARTIEFKLDSFTDILRKNITESVFDFQLEVLDAKQERLTTLPVVRLTQEIDVRVCHFELMENSRWRIHWLELSPLRYRRLRVWSLWQPWAPPIEIPLPDNAAPSDNHQEAGWWMTDIPAEIALPLAWYKAQFLAAAPDDSPPLPVLPPENTIEVRLAEPNQRLQQIDQELIEHSKRVFVLHAEKACIYDTQFYIPERDQEVKQCLALWREANPIHILGFQNWLAKRDSISSRAFLLYMFRIESIKNLKGYPRESIENYLEFIHAARTINPESARLILSMSKSPQVIIKALQILIQNEDDEAFNYIWNEIQSGRLSELDAAQALSCKGEFAYEKILEIDNSPSRSRLIVELSKKIPRPDLIVRRGNWIKCAAGWGKIINIAQGEEDCEYFFPTQEFPVLEVALRDGHSSQEIMRLNLKEEKMYFANHKGINQCGCGDFMAPGGKDTRPLWDEHKRFCSQADKMSFLPNPCSYEKPPRYFSSAPENLFS